MFSPTLKERCKRCGAAQFEESDQYGTRIVCTSGHDDESSRAMAFYIAQEETAPVHGHTGEGRPSDGNTKVPGDYKRIKRKPRGFYEVSRKNTGMDNYPKGVL